MQYRGYLNAFALSYIYSCVGIYSYKAERIRRSCRPVRPIAVSFSEDDISSREKRHPKVDRRVVYLPNISGLSSSPASCASFSEAYVLTPLLAGIYRDWDTGHRVPRAYSYRDWRRSPSLPRRESPYQSSLPRAAPRLARPKMLELTAFG